MQRLEVSGAVRLIYGSLDVKGLMCGFAAAACWDCGFESRWGHACLSVVCCQVEVSATGWSLVQRSLTKCSVSVCDSEALVMRRPWPTGRGGAVAPWDGGEYMWHFFQTILYIFLSCQRCSTVSSHVLSSFFSSLLFHPEIGLLSGVLLLVSLLWHLIFAKCTQT